VALAARRPRRAGRRRAAGGPRGRAGPPRRAGRLPPVLVGAGALAAGALHRPDRPGRPGGAALPGGPLGRTPPPPGARPPPAPPVPLARPRLPRASRWFRRSLLALPAAAWAMPGPVLGLGLKELFRTAVEGSEGVSRLPATLLWYGPSRLPLVAVDVIRFLP